MWADACLRALLLIHYSQYLFHLFRQAPAEKINYLRRLYPDCPWDQWLA